MGLRSGAFEAISKTRIRKLSHPAVSSRVSRKQVKRNVGHRLAVPFDRPGEWAFEIENHVRQFGFDSTEWPGVLGNAIRHGKPVPYAESLPGWDQRIAGLTLFGWGAWG